MTDGTTKVGPADKQRINIEQDHEVRYWCVKLATISNRRTFRRSRKKVSLSAGIGAPDRISSRKALGIGMRGIRVGIRLRSAYRTRDLPQLRQQPLVVTFRHV
jgi:hypothetical protein